MHLLGFIGGWDCTWQVLVLASECFRGGRRFFDLGFDAEAFGRCGPSIGQRSLQLSLNLSQLVAPFRHRLLEASLTLLCLVCNCRWPWNKTIKISLEILNFFKMYQDISWKCDLNSILTFFWNYMYLHWKHGNWTRDYLTHLSTVFELLNCVTIGFRKIF